jgi:hypothetical protein
MSVNQISVFVENKPGSLLGMTRVLAEAGIDMRAFSLAETTDFGIARLLVDDVIDTSSVLKEAGYIASVTPVLAVAVPDVPGGLNQVLQTLADGHVNVDYMYAFTGKQPGAYMVLRVADHKVAAGLLLTKGIRMLSQEDLVDL